MESLVVILTLTVLVSWVLAELRGGRVARFFTGAVAILVAYFIGQLPSGVVASYERTVTRASMLRIAELLGSGQTDRVRNAIETYNATAENGSTYAAARKMWDAVSSEQALPKQP